MIVENKEALHLQGKLSWRICKQDLWIPNMCRSHGCFINYETPGKLHCQILNDSDLYLCNLCNECLINWHVHCDRTDHLILVKNFMTYCGGMVFLYFIWNVLTITRRKLFNKSFMKVCITSWYYLRMLFQMTFWHSRKRMPNEHRTSETWMLAGANRPQWPATYSQYWICKFSRRSRVTYVILTWDNSM